MYLRHKARPKGPANPRGRSETKPTHRKWVAGQRKDRRPTGNRTGGGPCPARDRGGSMIPLGRREFHQHPRSHARAQLEITIVRRCRPYPTGLSGDSAIPESRATGATTSPIARYCDRPVDEVRGLPTIQSVKRGQRNTVRRQEERVTVKPLDKDWA